MSTRADIRMWLKLYIVHKINKFYSIQTLRTVNFDSTVATVTYFVFN